jgi:hypothetical protein
MMELRAQDPAAHRLIWHDLEREREAIERAIPGIVTVYGSQDRASGRRRSSASSMAARPELATKPVIAGAGCNFQRALLVGNLPRHRLQVPRLHPGDPSHPAVRQTHQCRIDLIYTEAERAVRPSSSASGAITTTMCAMMSEIIRPMGSASKARGDVLARTVETGTVLDSGGAGA